MFSLPYFAEGANEEFLELLFENREGERLASGTCVDDERAGRKAPGL